MIYRYKIGEVVAEGAQARVLRAKDRITGKQCILKTGDMIQREANWALEWNHPYILKPFDFGIHPELGPYSAFPEIQAPSLLEWARNNRSAENFQRVVIQIAEFLSFLHHRRFLYNDFKPDHFLVLDSEIRVLDLGLCSSFADHSSSVFSGTFPYISPERLVGRRFDQRSDIFALGMLLLHLFFPQQEWDFPPDILTLQGLQKNCEELDGYWKSLLSEMTAFEPNQRIESADELWDRLLLPAAKGTFLFFPLPDHSSFPYNFSSEKPILFVTSSSETALHQLENQALLHCWKNGIPSFHFDLQHQDVTGCFVNLLHSFVSQAPSDFLPTIEELWKLKLEERCFLIFHAAHVPSPPDRSSFAYAMSCLSQSSSFFVLITAAKMSPDLPEEIYTRIEPPVLNPESLENLLLDILPSHARKDDRFTKFRSGKFVTGEQVVEALRRDLPAEGFPYWPAAAKAVRLPVTLDSVGTQEMRVLACLAIAGGSLESDVLARSLPLKDQKQSLLMERLQSGGFLQKYQDRYHLSVPPATVLGRLRKDRIRDIATNLLSAWSGQGDAVILHHVARLARKHRLAALYALRAARQAERQQQISLGMEYYWKGHMSGARLSKRRLFALLMHSLRHAQFQAARKLLRQIRKRFGMSYRLADLYLEFHHRTNHPASAERMAARIVQRTIRKQHKNAREYFVARLAFFHVQQLKLEEAVKLSKQLLAETASDRIRSLAHNHLGVVHFYQGEFKEAAAELRMAIRTRHTFLPNSYMTLAMVLMRLGKLSAARNWLLRAIRIFNRRQDTDRLSIALLNLGLVYKQDGRLKEAREQYHQSLHLSRMNRNQYIFCAVLNNMAVTFELEGRTDRAIRLYTRSARAAGASGFKGTYAIAKANAGLQYAFQNRFSKAIRSLREAITIHKEMNWRVQLAEAQESLGVTYLLSNHFRNAEIHLKFAERLFGETGTNANLLRTQLLIALVWIRKGLFQKAKDFLDRTKDNSPDSFEKALHEYCIATWKLTAPADSIDGCKEALHEAERIFRNLPSAFWLAKTYQLKAQYHLRKDHYEKAHLASSSAFNIFSRLGARKEILNLTKESFTVNNPEDFINRMADRLPYKILQMIKEVLVEPDPEVMISKILSVSLEFSDMERAMLIVMDEPPRIFKSTTIDETTVQEMYEISKSAVEAAAQSHKPYVALDAVADPYLNTRPSIVAGRIMSIVCLPLRAQNRLIGVLYLDSREGVETLGKTESVLLEIFASLIALVLNKTLILEKSMAENLQLRSSLGLSSFPEIIGNSDALMSVLKSVHQLLNAEIPVLITGETGTGKELIARVLHYCGSRKSGSFIAINCSAITKTLLESELFGHEKGAFTGADSMKKGLFEQAKSGTLFLDEIGDMPHSMQAKLLRVLQEGEFRRVGGHETLRSNARIILATNRNLQQLVKKDQFREDLFYRIKGVQIQLPPLRERAEDIPLLATHFLRTSLLASRKRILGFTPETVECFKRYEWPGNARQLKNEVERVVALTEKEWIPLDEVDPEIRTGKEFPARKTETLKEREKQIILEALQKNKWNILQTAKALGLTRNGLYGKMKMHGVSKKVS